MGGAAAVGGESAVPLARAKRVQTYVFDGGGVLGFARGLGVNDQAARRLVADIDRGTQRPGPLGNVQRLRLSSRQTGVPRR